MSYGRDPDRHTRGVGAVASRDNVRPAQAAARRRAMNQLTVAHDRAVRQMTFGPRGGMGRVDLGIKGTSGGTAGGISTTTGRGVKFDYGTSNNPILPTAPGGPNKPPTAMPRTHLANPLKRTSVLEQILAPLRPPSGPPDPLPPPPANPPSTRPQPSPVVTRPSTPSGGGGGGGVWQPTTSSPTVEIPEEVIVPDVPEVSAPAVSGKTIAILGAAAVAAYFLVRKKRGA